MVNLSTLDSVRKKLRSKQLPFLSNASQPQLLNRFRLFLCQNFHNSGVVCTSKPDFDIRPSDEAKQPGIFKINTITLEEN